MASWTHNTNVIVSSYTPLQLITVIYPITSQGNTSTESLYEDDRVSRIMERQNEMNKMYTEQYFGQSFEKTAITRMRGYEGVIIEAEVLDYYQTQNEKSMTETIESV